jgi:hypothetical protein
MGLRLPSWSAVVCVSAAVVVGGCGAAVSEPVTDTQTVTVTVAAKPAHPRKAVAHRRHVAAVANGFTRCDANITARTSTTTCPFAQNAFYAYWSSGEGETIQVYSPATRRTYPTRCSVGTTRITCSTDDDGEVRFSRRSVDAYTQDQADAYAARADLGEDDPAPALEGSGAASGDDDDGGGGDAGAGCDPSYAGACLDADSFDYDCEGGSGDGPDYTGEVTVVGDDHFGLDRDGDGTACDS